MVPPSFGVVRDLRDSVAHPLQMQATPGPPPSVASGAAPTLARRADPRARRPSPERLGPTTSLAVAEGAGFFLGTEPAACIHQFQDSEPPPRLARLGTARKGNQNVR